MASIAKQHYLSLLIVLFISVSMLQIQAREGRFFSKVTRPENTNPNATAPVAQSPSPISSEQPSELPPQSHQGHGLYGQGSEKFVHVTTNTNSFDTPDSQYSSQPSFSGSYNEFNGNENEFNGNENEFNKEYSEENYKYENKVPSRSYSDNQFENNQYGVSDTRYFEDGKNYYDINDERKENQKYYPTIGNEVEGYGTYNYNGDSRDGNNYGNNGEHGTYSYNGNSRSGNYGHGDRYHNYNEYQNSNNVGQYENNQEVEEFDPVDP